MRTLAVTDSQAPEVQQVARSLGNPEAIDAWLRYWWQFVPDPVEYEYITAPTLQLRLAVENGGILKGDCDEAATLAASLLAALDWPSRFVAIRNRAEADFSHVFLRTPLFEYAGAGSSELQLDIDPTVPASLLPLRGDFELMTVQI